MTDRPILKACHDTLLTVSGLKQWDMTDAYTSLTVGLLRGNLQKGAAGFYDKLLDLLCYQTDRVLSQKSVNFFTALRV
jgi:hypothetical protein